MEIHQYLNFDLNPLLFITLLMILLIITNECKKYNHKSKKLPPSPFKLPLIGHLHHLMGGLPHHTLTRVAQKYGPVVHLDLGQVPAVVISSPEAAKEVLKVHDPACAERHESLDIQIMRYENSDVAFSPYDEYWRQMRKICILKLLSVKNVKSFASIRQEEVSGLIKSIEEESLSSVGGGEVVINLTKKLVASTNSITCRTAFGKVTRDQEKSIALLLESMPMTGGLNMEDLLPSYKLLHVLITRNKHKLVRIHRALESVFDVVLEEHQLKQSSALESGGSEDIIDVLLRMQKNGELPFDVTNDHIKGAIFELFSAGTLTSSTVNDWVMVELMRNPRVMAKAQAEVRRAFEGKKVVEESDIQALKYLKLVIKETLRLHPPVPLIPRSCREECQVDGYSIPLKSRVIINIWSIGRDPKYWDDVTAFKPERFENSSIDFAGNNFEYIPFGAGRRICPGVNFGLANVELTVSKLLYHFDWEVPKGTTREDIDMTEEHGIISSRKNGLFVVPKLFNISSVHQE